jgi:hypothetical protein
MLSGHSEQEAKMQTFKITYFKGDRTVDVGVNVGDERAVKEASALFACEQGYDAIQFTNLSTLGLGPHFHYQQGRVDPREVLGFLHETSPR